MVTDFDCLHPGNDVLTLQDIVKVRAANSDKAKHFVARLARMCLRSQGAR
jgi:hypothetical protein